MNGPFRAEREKIFFDPFLDIFFTILGKIFLHEDKRKPSDSFPEGIFFFRFFFFFFRRFTFFPPPPKLALGLSCEDTYSLVIAQ